MSNKKILVLLFSLIFWFSFLYISSILLHYGLYSCVKPGFSKLTSYFGYPEWGRILAIYFPMHFLVLLSFSFSLLLKSQAKSIFYSSIAFLMVSYIESLINTYPSWIQNFRLVLFYLMMFVFGASICFIFFLLQERYQIKKK